MNKSCLVYMVQRRIADLWRQAAADVPATVNWAAMYKTLLGELVALSAYSTDRGHPFQTMAGSIPG